MPQRLIIETFCQTLRSGLAIDRAVIVTRSKPGQWQVYATASESLQHITYPHLATNAFPDLPHKILETVLLSQGFVSITESIVQAPFIDDPYWQDRSPVHLICLPLQYNQELLGAVYLERMVVPHQTIKPWSVEQIDLIKGICYQMAISLFYCLEHTHHSHLAHHNMSAPTTAITPQPISERFQTSRTFQQIVENANDVIFMITIDGRFSYLSPKFQDLVGAPPEQYINQSFTQIAHPDDISRMYRMLRLQLRNRQQVDEFEFRLRRQDGSYTWAAANNSAPLADAYGNLIGFQGIIRNINTRKLAEQALQHTQERLQFLLSTTPAIIHSVSLSAPFDDPENHRISFISDNVTQILGYSINEFRGTLSTWLQQIHPEDVDRVWQLYCHTVTDRGACQTEYRLRNQQGKYQWLYSAIKVLVNEAGEAIETVGYTADITARKLAEAQLIQTNEQLVISNSELARATRLKDEFLANMSHELRTPLNAILGISEAMLEEFHGPLSDQYRKSLKIVAQSGTHLLELINDILDLAKIEAGKLEVKPSPTAIKDLCESSLTFVRQIALNKGVQLNHDAQYGEDQIHVDERRMRQVLINLLSNAVKFTPSGGSVELIANYNADNQAFEFQVCDTGIGIAAEHLAQLFQPFLQIDSSLSRQFSGTGLGLTLVKRIVQLHQGTIEVQSQINQGSCFTVSLPTVPTKTAAPSATKTLAPIQAEPAVRKATHPEAPLVLLAEDNAMNIDILCDYLHSQGYEVIVAHNGIEAITLTKARSPQIILMDIQMPQMDGLEATRQIRSDPDCQHIPIIALTALAMRGDADRCRQAGANDYLSKPVKLKQLIAVIEQYLLACPC